MASGATLCGACLVGGRVVVVLGSGGFVWWALQDRRCEPVV
jgi:hypothetical protein